MSLAYRYAPPSSSDIAAAVQSLTLAESAAVVRSHFSVSASSRSLDLARRNAVTNPENLLSLSEPSVAEGDSGNVVLRFVLSRAADGFPDIAYSAQTLETGTATVDVDFEEFTDSGTIASGASVNLDVNVIGDTDEEDDETVVMQVTGTWA